jgi:hypothetical protein
MGCKVFISSTNTTTGRNLQTHPLRHRNGYPFEPLTPQPRSNYDGSNDFAAYRIEWYHDGDLMTGKNTATLSTALENTPPYYAQI